jgi:mannose-6-phosphate isomerase-like protein (cupin superfamily)
VINLTDLKQFSPDHYARHLVLKTATVEIIVVCWLPGHCSPVHGHGTSDAVMVILEGEMAYSNYYPDGRVVSGKWNPGDIGHVPVGVQHRIANHGTTELVTLHIYSPPIDPALQGFDLGYANEVSLHEVQLPDEAVVRYIKAVPPVLAGAGVNPDYVI